MFLELTSDEVDYICDQIEGVYDDKYFPCLS